MKKLLALVLALVMTLGLATVSSNAAFSDADSIEYTEAVDVMAGLKILEGYDTGDFKPATVLNREQAAKIIAYMQLGKKTADALNVKSSFTDTQGNWAESYIAYCVSQGIIAGVGDNKFNPKGELTGYAFAKMVLCALGYDAEYEGFVGSGWEIKVAKMVNTLKVNDSMTDVALSAGMTREQASQMAFNALFQPTKNFNKGTQISGTNLSVSTGGSYGLNGVCLYNSVFGGKVTANEVVTYGVVTKNASNDADYAKNGTTEVKPLAAAAIDLNIDTGADLIGKYVKVYYKDAYTSSAKPGTVFALVDQTIETKVTKDMTAKELKAALTADKYDVTANVAFTNKYQNGAETSAAKTVVPGTTSGSGLGAMTLYGYWDNTNKVAQPYGYALADTYTVDKVTAISTVSGKESITLNGEGLKQNNATTDVINAYDGIAKNDLVAVYKFGAMYNLVKLDKVTGKATFVNVKSGSESVTVGGTTYSFSGATNKSGETDVAVSSIGYTDDYELYLDGNGKVALVKGVAAESDLIYVVETYETTATGDYGAGATKYFVQGVNTSGLEVKYQVYHATNGYFLTKADAANDTDGVNEIETNTLYTVTTKYDSTQKATMAEFAAITGSTKGAVKHTNAAMEKTAKTDVSNGAYYFASDVKFIFVKDSKADLKVTVVDGMNAVPASTVYTTYGTKASTATNYDVHYVFVSAAPTAASSSEIVFAAESGVSTSKVPYTDENGQSATAYQHTVYVDGVKTTIKTTDDTAISGFKTVSTNETTGISTYTSYTDTTTATAKVNETASKVYNELLTAVTVTNAELANAKIVDLTGNNIETVAGLKSLVDCGGTVKVAYVYDNTNSVKKVSIVYITKATFTATLAKDGTIDYKMNAAVTDDTFGTSNANIAVDGITYKWERSASTTDASYSTVADAVTASYAGTVADNGHYFKCTITVTTTTGETFTATSSAVACGAA